MELLIKLLEEIAHDTRPKIEEHMLIVIDNSTQEQHLSQPLQTKNKQFKTAFTFLTGYNGIFNVKKSNNKFYFKKTITNEDGFIQITFPPGAYEIESLNDENKRIIIDEGFFTEADYPFQIKPNISTFGSIITIMSQVPIISFVFEDSMRNHLGFEGTILYQEDFFT